MDFDIARLGALDRERLINSLVVPRPIAWVTSQDSAGIRNLAPFSYFNLISVSPPLLVISIRGPKDTLRNIEATGEFVVNITSRDLSVEMVASSEAFPPEVDEIEVVGLDTTPSHRVAVPRLSSAKAALECRHSQIIALGDGMLVVGEILHVHVADTVIAQDRIDVLALAPLGRLGGAFYTTPESPFRIDKP